MKKIQLLFLTFFTCSWQLMPSKPTAAILLRNTYGVKEFGKPDKVDTNTLLMIGSNTKVVNLRYGQ